MAGGWFHGCGSIKKNAETVGSLAHRRGVKYETSFQFLKKQRNLNLSTSVAHLKEFFSTTKAH
jgi:hypothetical protein